VDVRGGRQPFWGMAGPAPGVTRTSHVGGVFSTLKSGQAMSRGIIVKGGTAPIVDPAPLALASCSSAACHCAVYNNQRNPTAGIQRAPELSRSPRELHSQFASNILKLERATSFTQSIASSRA
jgi:hypothetical protein